MQLRGLLLPIIVHYVRLRSAGDTVVMLEQRQCPPRLHELSEHLNRP